MPNDLAIVISSVLKHNNILEVLSLSWNKFQHGFDLCHKATKLAGWRYHNIGDTGASDFLTDNSTVETLDLLHSNIAINGYCQMC